LLGLFADHHAVGAQPPWEPKLPVAGKQTAGPSGFRNLWLAPSVSPSESESMEKLTAVYMLPPKTGPTGEAAFILPRTKV